MRLLIDSQIVVWWLSAAEPLNAEARDAIADQDNEVYYSAATVWELELEMDRGKLQMPSSYLSALDEAGFSPLSVSTSHAHAATALPRHHNNPFDRLLIAQALKEGLVLVTADSRIFDYEVPLLKAV